MIKKIIFFLSLKEYISFKNFLFGFGNLFIRIKVSVAVEVLNILKVLLGLVPVPGSYFDLILGLAYKII